MGLDTDDIVALSIDIPLIVIAILMVIALFFMKSPRIRKEMERMLLKKENANTPLLAIVYGQNSYKEYINFLSARAQTYFNADHRVAPGSKWEDVYDSEQKLITAYINKFIPPSDLWHAIDDKLTGKDLR